MTRHSPVSSGASPFPAEVTRRAVTGQYELRRNDLTCVVTRAEVSYMTFVIVHPMIAGVHT